jgi:hypothetical protein
MIIDAPFLSRPSVKKVRKQKNEKKISNIPILVESPRPNAAYNPLELNHAARKFGERLDSHSSHPSPYIKPTKLPVGVGNLI